MSDQRPPSIDALTPEAERQVDEACNRFEAAWKGPIAPRIEDFLEGWAGAERHALLYELVGVDADYRRVRGEAVRTAAYLGRFADLDRAWLDAVLLVGTELPNPTPRTADSEARTIELSPAQDISGRLRSFGDYELLEEIARGGMGVVYRARQRSLNRLVALKMMLAGEFATPEEVQRFRTEEKAIANLDHPNIVPIYDIGEYLGQPYFSMKIIEGQSLSREVPYYVKNAPAAVSLLARVARAVAHAHRRGILHRDLKPGNILLDAHREPHVTDFGLAKKLEANPNPEADLTRSGAVVGTPEFMAPEQARAQKGLTTAVDVYSLGAILYTLLTGRPPFKGSNLLDTLRQVAESDPVSPRTVNPQVDRDLEIICLKCLEKEPSRRYASADALADDLERWQTGEPIEARPMRSGERLWRWCRRKPAQAGLVGTAGLLPLLVAVVASIGYVSTSSALGEARWAQGQEAQQRQVAENEKAAAEREREKVRQERDKLNSLLYLANMPQAQRAHEAGDLARLRTILDQHRPQAGWTDPRGWEWFFLQAVSQGELLGVHGHSSPVLAVAFTSDGKRLASADNNGAVKIWEVDTSKEVGTFRAQAKGVYALSWDPDGRRLALVGGDETVQVWDTATGNKILSLPAAVQAVMNNVALAWSPDGKRLATGDKDGAVRVWDAATGKEGLVLQAGGVLALAWSPDGKRLASFGAGLVKLWDAATGEQAFTFWELQQQATGLIASSACAVAWSPDSKRVHVTLAKGDGIVMAWDAATGAVVFNLTLLPRQLPNGQVFQSPFSRLVWSPDGKRLASVIGSDGPVQLWDAASGEEILSLGPPRDPQKMLAPQLWTVALAWSADGRRLVRTSGDNSIEVWEPMRARLTMRTLTIPSLSAPAWTADSRQFVGPGTHGTIRFWDAATGEMTRTLGADASPLCAAAWSQDGHRLATANRAGVIEVRDAATGKKTLALSGNTGAVATLVWSPDGRKLGASAEDRTIRVWDLATGKEVFHRQPPRTASDAPVLMTWSFDGRWLLVRTLWSAPPSPWSIEVWDATSGRQALNLGRMLGVQSVLWSPTGGRLASLSTDGTVKVWEPESGREIFSLKTTAAVLVWEAEGKRLAALCRTGTVQIWDAATGDERFNQAVPDTNERPPVLGGFWSLDGRCLALTSPQGTIRIWESATGKIVLTLRAPAGAQVAAVWSPDGRRLASTSTDAAGKGTVQVWNLADGKEVFHLDGLQRHPLLTGADWLSWSPDGRQLAGALVDGTIPVWDATTGATVFTLSGLDTLRSALGPGGRPETVPTWDPKSRGKTLTDCLLWNPNGQTVAVVSANGTVPVRAVATGKEVFTLATREAAGQPPESLALVAASLDGRSLASASSTGTVKVWQAATGYETLVLEDAPSPISSFTWSPDGERLAWRSVSNQVQVSDATGKKILALRARNGPSGRWGSALLWSPDSKRLASSGPGGLQIWDATTGAEILDVQGSWGGQRDVLNWSPDSGRLAAVGNQSAPDKERVEEVRIWDAATGKEVQALRSVVKAPRVGPIALLEWSADGRWIAAARTDGLIKVWETATGKEILDLPASAQGGPPGRGFVPRLAWNPDGRRLAVVTADGTIQIRDVVAGKEVLALGGQAGQIASLAWSPDGKSLASGSAFFNQGQYERAAEVKVWDGATGKEILTRALDKGPVFRVAWSPDGLHLASASKSSNQAEVRVWEVSTSKEILHVGWAVFDCWLAWAPTGQRLVASAPGMARVWDLATGKEALNLRDLPGLPFLTDSREVVAWHPDGQRLAAASTEWTVKVWDATTGKEVLSLGRSVGALPPGLGLQNSAVLAWSPDGKRLATSAQLERTIKVWDVATGKILTTCRQQDAALRALAWDANGKQLASAGEDATVKVWDPATGELLRSFEYAYQATPSAIPSKPRGAGLLAWKHDGLQLAMAGEDSAIRVWDTTTGEKVTYFGHGAPVSSVAWSADGKRLASASSDGIIKLWDAATGQEVYNLRVSPNPGQPLGSLAWSPDGWQLALFRPMGTITVWDAHSGAD